MGFYMIKIIDVKVLDHYQLSLVFNDGVQGTVDLSDLAGKGVFKLWRDRKAFKSVQIGSGGELVWNDQIDLCPDSLYLKATGMNPEDLFPTLKREPSHA
jgi:hypothetical protein